MMKFLRRWIPLITGIVFISIIGLLLVTTYAQATTSPSKEEPVPEPAEILLSSTALDQDIPTASLPTPPQLDPCLHCHILGEEKGLWIPLARWTLFGSMGLVFVFGVYRSASVWTNRAPWKPLMQRTTEWVDNRYQVSEPLSKLLSKPVPKYALRWWYCLGGITAFLFVTQAVTGIMLAFYYQPTPDAAYASIQYIESQVRFGASFRAIPW